MPKRIHQNSTSHCHYRRDDIQREVWQKACSLREKPKKPKTLPEPPAEVLRREWQKALVDIANDYEQKRKASAKHNPIDYKKVVMNAFKRIAWNVPKQAFDCLQPTYTMSIKEIMDPTYQRHFWYAGCKAMNKTRDFYLTTGRDQLMSPDFEQEIQAPGISKYTSLPITLDDKVDITQLRYDYQRNIELHQMSFQDWLQHSNVNNLMAQGDEPLEFDEPQILKNITQLGHRDFFLANWMMDYSITKLGFEMWYNYIGKDLKIPCDYKQTIAKETPKPSPHQEQARKLAQMPKLGNYLPSPEPEPTKKRKICNLSNPPDILKEIKKETKTNITCNKLAL